VGRLGDGGPADEIFETLLRHRPPSISPDTAAFHAKRMTAFRPKRLFRQPGSFESLVLGSEAKDRSDDPSPVDRLSKLSKRNRAVDRVAADVLSKVRQNAPFQFCRSSTFKAGRASQPDAWKVRFLRRLVGDSAGKVWFPRVARKLRPAGIDAQAGIHAWLDHRATIAHEVLAHIGRSDLTWTPICSASRVFGANHCALHGKRNARQATGRGA
jgi:hypothetical protein